VEGRSRDDDSVRTIDTEHFYPDDRLVSGELERFARQLRYFTTSSVT